MERDGGSVTAAFTSTVSRRPARRVEDGGRLLIATMCSVAALAVGGADIASADGVPTVIAEGGYCDLGPNYSTAEPRYGLGPS
jgi:hypothetical protein